LSALPRTYDWKRPDILAVIQERTERLRRLRANPAALSALRTFYADNPAQFIDDWGTTHDPRNPERGLPATIPFRLFPRQFEMIEWFLERWRGQQNGIVEKSRDVGASWLMMTFAATMCLFHRGLTFGVGSRKEELIDRSGDPSCLFFKARMFLQHLPAEFLGNWSVAKNAAHMRISFPSTGCALVGEAGDNIGRGGRTSMFFVDEAAFIERPELIDGSLSATTNSRIDLSTPNGRGNPFAEKRFAGKVPVFTFSYRDDPRKDDAWLAKQREQLDEVTLAREVLLDYSGSVAYQLIPAQWVAAAVDAHLKLGIEPSGLRTAGFDVADTGIDLCAVAIRYGLVLVHIESWSGKATDIYGSTARAFSICDAWKCTHLNYDSDGLGSGVRGDARVLNEQRRSSSMHEIRDTPYRGSGAVEDPEREMVPGRLNRDFFANMKAMAWWSLRLRFQATYQAVVEHKPYVADNLVSISSKIPELTSLILELSQPSFSLNNAGKVLVDKAPDNARSPNLADAVVIAYSPINRALEIWKALGAAEKSTPSPSEAHAHDAGRRRQEEIEQRRREHAERIERENEQARVDARIRDAKLAG
jgi:phage terminase large subunit